MSERQSSFDGGLPFPAPGNVHHINRPKSMMMLLMLMMMLLMMMMLLLMMMMMRLMIGDKLTTYCLVTAILLRGTQEWRKERRRIDSPSSVSSTISIIHPSDEDKEDSSSLLCSPLCQCHRVQVAAKLPSPADYPKSSQTVHSVCQPPCAVLAVCYLFIICLVF